MILSGEDAFAIHIVANSADTMLRALVKASGKPDHADWDQFLRPGNTFYKEYRAVPNYLKHADKDPLETVNVFDEVHIVELMTLFNIERYKILYNTPTKHMLHYLGYLASVWPPDLWSEEFSALNVSKLRETVIDQTVGFSRDISRKMLAQDPEAEQERTADLADMQEANATLVRDYGQ